MAVRHFTLFIFVLNLPLRGPLKLAVDLGGAQGQRFCNLRSRILVQMSVRQGHLHNDAGKGLPVSVPDVVGYRVERGSRSIPLRVKD